MMRCVSECNSRHPTPAVQSPAAGTMTSPEFPLDEGAKTSPPSDGGAKLFVIFFLTLVPLIGMALVAMVIYGLLVR